MPFDKLLDARLVRAVYQPLVDLVTGDILGFEALARGPWGTPWERPDLLFAAAREAGRVAELDWVCRAAAYTGALQARLAPGLSLFVNTEPDALGTPCPEDLADLVGTAERSLRVISEMTERSLTRDPKALLDAVSRARQVGWGVALDDVGAEPGSLALMPFVHPDVIKLDMALVQDLPSPRTSAVVSAVSAQAERTGALVLAEGIETEQHRQRALALGATIGQGWLFGRPGSLPADTVSPAHRVPLLRAPQTPMGATPYSLVEGRRSLRLAAKALLLPMTKHLEERARDRHEPPVVLATFQDARHFTPLSAGRYDRLTGTSALVAAMGVGISNHPIGRVRGAHLAPGDPLGQEWDVIVVGPHYAGALIARDLGDTGPDADRRFSFLVTHDRELVVQAARALLLRLVPTPVSTQLDHLVQSTRAREEFTLSPDLLGAG
jgi:EAL domain-containing protein (putative c-di-GMP-specific phosphodiesterase class I)/DICT domain-containing protein